MASKPRIICLAGLAGVSLMSSQARAQFPAAVPGMPAAAVPAAGLAAPAAVPAVPAGGGGLLGFLGLSKANMSACAAQLCQKPMGQMLNNGLMTFGAMTGGMIHPLCPQVPTASQLAAMAAAGGPNGAEAVAAKIKQDEADAKARVAAVEYLATVDCRYWKEAKIALLNSLRADRNECVRFAAARALASGCCCSKETIEALRISVAGEDTDGFPGEMSPRVRAAAFTALQNCLLKVPDVGPAVVPEAAPAPAPAPVVQPETTAANTGLGPDGARLVAAVTPVPGSVPNSGNTVAGVVRAVPSTAPMVSNPAAAPVALTAAPSLAQVPPTAAAPATMTAPPEVPSLADRLRTRPMARVIDDARNTLITTAQAPPPVNYMPTGKRSLLEVFVKARHDYSNYAQKQAAGSMGGPSQAPVYQAPAAPASNVQPAAPAASTTRMQSPDSAKTNRSRLSRLFSRRRGQNVEP